mgnify:FL=1|jgi:tRNA threonylcarbamoyladenosine biosynthesis protein TsaB
MNRWLAFDTSTDVLSLAVAQGEQVWSQNLPGGAQASASLIPAVMDLLAQASLPLTALDAIVFGRGPGSFTGLRTACSVAQGLALGAQLPVLPVDTLLAVAEEARVQAGSPDTLTVLAMLDARMDEVYSATYRWSAGAWAALSPLQVGAPEQVAVPPGSDVVLAGNVFDAYGERLPAGQRVQALPTAAALLRLAPALWASGQAVPAEQAMPLYIRDKVAQTTAEREAQKAQASPA